MSQDVQNMFASIAKHYDLANDILSFGMHRLWREQALDQLQIKGGEKVLDLCTGTGDVAFAVAKRLNSDGEVLGLDFVSEMVELAKLKLKKKSSDFSTSKIAFSTGDAMKIDTQDNSFDLITISFGIRNVDNTLCCLKEIKRVLKSNGQVLVLEFGQPTLPGFSHLYNFYSKFFMPFIGGVITGNKHAYTYLPETSANFPAGKQFTALMQEAGLTVISSTPLMTGIAYIYIAKKI
jgi:demethylmenaquinone methyltransferase / 2-methoxy-6-polyprenyl-1,4-benzoquinol methylase